MIISSFLGQEILKQPVRIDNNTFKLLQGSRYLVGGYGVTLDSDLVVTASTSLDIGSLTANTLYYVYIVVSGGVASVKLSLSSSAPSGYLAYKKIGYLTTTKFSFFIKQDLFNYGKLGETKYLNNNTAPLNFISATGSILGLNSGNCVGVNYFPLYEYLWDISTSVSADPYFISSTKGVNALTDWNAGKTITIDESGLFTRAYKSGTTNGVGQKQDDAFQGHWHSINGSNLPTKNFGDGTFDARSTTAQDPDLEYNKNINSTILSPVTDGTNGTPRTAAETRPTNVAKYVFIRYEI